MKEKCSMSVFFSWVFEGLFTCYQLPFSLVLERMLNLEIVDRQMIWKIYETLQIHSDDMTLELKIRGFFLLIIAIFFLSSFEHWFSLLYAKKVVFFSEGNNFTLYHTMCATEKRLTSSFKVVFFLKGNCQKISDG